MSERTCGNCRWWWRATKTNGVCRRHPPQVCDDAARWPEIIAKGWCGEWADGSITPEQEQRREMVRQFAVALLTRHGDSLAPYDAWQLAAEMADAEPKGG